MSYRIYLQTPDGSTFERTETGSRSIADSAFRTFLDRDELKGKPVSVHLVYERDTLAVHRFDASSRSPDNWRAKVEEIPWPEEDGKRGRPRELEGGARHQVYLDARSIARAKKLGKGNVSEGIRIALSRI